MTTQYATMQNTSTFEVTCLPGYIQPPFRLNHPFPTKFQIQAYPNCRPENTVVHITTASSALVTYILGPMWEEELGDGSSIAYLGTSENWTDTDEESLALRIIKTGGTVIDTSEFPEGYGYDWSIQQFESFSRAKRFMFGWPDEGGVWVLHLNGLVPYEFWQKPPIKRWDNGFATLEALREMEEEEEEYGKPFSLPSTAIDTKKLNEARTMSDYCEELRHLGAVYYTNPGDSKEVQEAGVLDISTLTKLWSGFASWKAAIDQRREERRLARAEAMAVASSPKPKSSGISDRCIVM